MSTKRMYPEYQEKKGAIIFVTREMEYFTAEQIAEKIAKMCCGLWNWQGAREVKYQPAGLMRLANQYLRRQETHMRVAEVPYGDGTSDYFPVFNGSIR